jgi:hypothetical protein
VQTLRFSRSARVKRGAGRLATVSMWQRCSLHFATVSVRPSRSPPNRNKVRRDLPQPMASDTSVVIGTITAITTQTIKATHTTRKIVTTVTTVKMVTITTVMSTARRVHHPQVLVPIAVCPASVVHRHQAPANVDDRVDVVAVQTARMQAQRERAVLHC